jgi:hypothetical protein
MVRWLLAKTAQSWTWIKIAWNPLGVFLVKRQCEVQGL